MMYPQTAEVLAMLRKGPVSNKDAYPKGIYRLGARIYDLRKMGFDIKTVNRTGRNKRNRKVSWASYVLVSSP